jgi:hypothetical protein
MKIDEIMIVEAAPARVDAATRQAKMDRAAKLNAKLNAPAAPTAAPEEPEEPATKPAVQRPKADPFGQMVNQLQPPQQSSTGGTTTQIAGGTRHTANPNNPNLKQPEAPAAAAEKPAAGADYSQGGAGIKNVQATPQYKPGLGKKPAATPTAAEPTTTPAAAEKPVPGAGMPTPPGAGMPGRKATGPEFSNIVGSNFMKGFAQGVGSGDLSNAVNAASQSNIAAQKAKDGTPAVPGEEQPAADPATAKAGEKELSPGASVPGTTSAGAATPDQEVTLANPIAKPGAEKSAAAPAAAKGKTMTKQEILAWISRNDEDNPALQSFKDGITAAEKAGAPAAEPAAAGTPNYGKATPGILNVQATPSKVTATPKTAAPAAKPNYGAPKVAVPAAKQPQMASKQYKKAPL